MILRYTALFCLFATCTLAQPIRSTAQRTIPITGESVVNIGRQFLGKPYVAHTLETGAQEQLVVNLEQFDCTTFIETTLALALTAQERSVLSETAQMARFRQHLTALRYRDGRINGYASRLHYLSDWLRDNERRGLLQDVTRDLGGSMSVQKSLYYMTTALHKYPQLNDSATYQQMTRVQRDLSQRPFWFIPAKTIRSVEAQLEEGDVVLLTAARPGLDTKHVGFVTWQTDPKTGQRRAFLLHASSEYGRVMITHCPLAEYVLYNRRLSGIRVARLRNVAPTAMFTAQAR